MCVHVCERVCEREYMDVCVCVCVCVCERERERESISVCKFMLLPYYVCAHFVFTCACVYDHIVLLFE